MSSPLHTVMSRAKRMLAPVFAKTLEPADRLARYKEFLQAEQAILLEGHRCGAGGVETCSSRAEVIDALLACVHQEFTAGQPPLHVRFAIVAVGGYGRGILNPYSDIDLLFLTQSNAQDIHPEKKRIIESILYLLWDLGFKVGQSVRSCKQCVIEALADQQSKTAMMDTRLIAGSEILHKKFVTAFQKKIVGKNKAQFLQMRLIDQKTRHEKYSNTPFLQEPNVKESCGGLRDYQNILWITRALRGTADLATLVKEESLSPRALTEAAEAYDFLLRVRNELHYQNGSANDILTLRLQGVVATAFNYPQKSILRRTEAFMRDYYTHTRHLWQHGNSLMEIFNLESRDQAQSGLRSFLSFRKKKIESFDGFTSREGRIWLSSTQLFQQDSHAMMRVFQHTQVRNLKLSPPIRKMLRSQLHLMDRNFLYATANRETFQAILERKGDVARVLRQMHRVGFLGTYLPEFGALDCLVQHEFFHRYTADEHTLRCIDQLDHLIAEENPRTAFYRKLFLDIADPYAIYLAFILHDSGRAEDVREHTDGSMMLANQVCKRLRITGSRRALIMFLVDNHLLFWLTATTRNLEEPEVIAEFAAIMKTPENLDALMLFTYCDSNGTSPDAWTGWKESLMRQLHSLTRRFLREGRSAYEASLEESKNELRAAVLAEMRQDYHPWVNEHFDRMPSASFSFKQTKQLISQIRTVRHFSQREEAAQIPYCMKWIDFADKGYSELIVATRNRRNLLEKLCCALASEQINILSADFHTRTDGIVVNLFRVCDTSFQPIADTAMRKRFQTTFDTIFEAEEYDPAKYLKRKRNFLAPRNDEGIAFPVRSLVSNDPHGHATIVEIQALDRIGLLHDLFHTINIHHLDTVHARICTEKGAAVDTLYITHPGGAKVTDPQKIEELQKELNAVISRQDS